MEMQIIQKKLEKKCEGISLIISLLIVRNMVLKLKMPMTIKIINGFKCVVYQDNGQ
jgi:hypothetical protein